MKALLCGGGTAGHVMPAIAISEILENEFPNITVAFAGRMNGSENKAYSETGRTLYTVDISGIPRSLNVKSIKALFKILKSGKRARDIIAEFRPDVIIGTGGYVCYPFLRQGQRLGIKTIMHESNVAPGLVTKILGPRCDKLLLNVEGTKKHLRKTENALVVGNPLRKGFSTLTRSEAKRRLGIPETKKLIVSFGGSLGAEVLNSTVMALMEEFIKSSDDVFHIHATGRSHFEKTTATHRELLKRLHNVRLVPYIEDMPTVLRAADIAITRSGAITVSEILKCATPSILIPSPNVTANHQYINAEYMQSRGAAILIEEKELTTEKLRSEVSALLESTEKRRQMAACAKRIFTPDTDAKIAEAIREVTEWKSP